MTMAATSPVDSIWTRKTMRLCRLSLRRPGVISSCQLAVPSPLVVLSLCRPLFFLSPQLVSLCLSPSSQCAALSLACRASWLLLCLSPSSRCAALSSSCHASWLLHCLSLSSRCAPCRPLVLSLRRLVVASPLNALPSLCLVVSSCRLSLSRRASWLSRHHLSSSSRCTDLSSSHRAG